MGLKGPTRRIKITVCHPLPGVSLLPGDFFVTVVVVVTLRIIYVIHSANIGEPCRKASA